MAEKRAAVQLNLRGKSDIWKTDKEVLMVPFAEEIFAAGHPAIQKSRKKKEMAISLIRCEEIDSLGRRFSIL